MSATVKVLFFASLREEVGAAELAVQADDLSALLAAVRARLGSEAARPLEQENVRVAVNQQLVDGDVKLADGDEVAFLPPVTGG